MANDFAMACESGSTRSDVWDSASGEAGRATAGNSVLERRIVCSDFAYGKDGGEGVCESTEYAKCLEEGLGSEPAAGVKGGVAYRFVKRVFDIVFSACVCVVLAIPVALVCVAVAIDSPGAPFFRQKRVGKGGKPIYIFKIRSMYSDSHEHPDRYLDEAQLAQWKREQKVDYDPRVTRVGRVIRKTSLDELPQFLNVLTADLSVIGPRPVTVE